MTLEETKTMQQLALKSRVIVVSMIILCALAVIIAMFFWAPSVKFDTRLIEEKEKQRMAIENQNNALQGLITELQRGKKIKDERDSMLVEEVRLNRAEIVKIKIPNERIKVFDNYLANDWSAYFSQLPEPQGQ